MYSYVECTDFKTRVPEEEAFEYAKQHLDELDEDDRKEFVEWFFSGNWIKEEGEYDHRGRWKTKAVYPWI